MKAVALIVLFVVAASNADCPYKDGARGEFRTCHSLLTDEDQNVIRSTLQLAKHNGKVAQKIFLKYFKAHPNARKAFPAFADVPLDQLSTNAAFLSNAYTCYTSFHTSFPLDGNIKSPKNCPYFKTIARKYDVAVFKDFGRFFLEALEEELGSAFTAEAKAAFKQVFMVMMMNITK